MKSSPWWFSFLVSNHEVILGLLVYPLITAMFTVASRKRTPEQWEAWALTKPFLAFLLEFMKASGLNPVGMLKAVRNYSARKAGQVPEGAIRASGLPEPLKAALLNPALHAVLTEAARLHAEAQAKPPAPIEPTPPASTAPATPPDAAG